MPAIDVVRALATKFDDATGDILATLAFFAKAVIFQLQHGGERKGVVGAGHMDVLRCDPSHTKDARGSGFTSDRRDRSIVVEGVATRLGDTTDHTHNVDGTLPQVTRALRRRDN